MSSQKQQPEKNQNGGYSHVSTTGEDDNGENQAVAQEEASSSFSSFFGTSGNGGPSLLKAASKRQWKKRHAEPQQWQQVSHEEPEEQPPGARKGGGGGSVATLATSITTTTAATDESRNFVIDDEDDEQDREQEADDEPLEEPPVFLLSIDEAIEKLGMGMFQIYVLIAAGLCFAADAMQVLLLSFLTIILQHQWHLTDQETALITSCLFAGALVGTLVLGPLADVYGRRPVFLLAAANITLFGMGTALVQHYFQLLMVIFFVGFGVGGLTVPFDVLAEFLPAKGRGTNLLLIEYFWTVGCLYVVAVAYWTLGGSGGGSSSDHAEALAPALTSTHENLIPGQDGGGVGGEWNLETATSAAAQQEDMAWRIFVALCALPCLCSWLIGYCVVPESARWLVSQGSNQQAMHVIRQAAVLNGLDVEQVFPPGCQLKDEAHHHKEGGIADLFTPQWREITLRLWGTWAAFAFGYYGVIMATTRVFESEDNNDRGDEEGMLAASGVEPEDFDFQAIFLSSAAELVGTTLVIVAVDRVGRIPSQFVSYGLAGLSVGALCFLASTGSSTRVELIACGFVARVFEMAGSCVTWVSTAEILTTEVRGTGHATANAMARLGAMAAPFVVQNSNMDWIHIGVVMVTVHAFTMFCLAKLPETAGKDMGNSSSSSDHEALTSSADEDDDDGNADVEEQQSLQQNGNGGVLT